MSVPFDNTSACHKKKETELQLSHLIMSSRQEEEEAGPSGLATREMMSIRVHVTRRKRPNSS